MAKRARTLRAKNLSEARGIRKALRFLGMSKKFKFTGTGTKRPRPKAKRRSTRRRTKRRK